MRRNGVLGESETKRQPAAAGTAAAVPSHLTRGQVAERLGSSIASVRRLEGKALHPTKGMGGVHLFDPEEVAALVADRTIASTVRLRRSADGDLAAEAFKRFNQGLGVRQVVIELRQPPEVIQDLHRQWREAGGLWIPSDVLKKIRKSIAARYADTRDVRIARSQDLVDVMHEVLCDLDDTRERHWDGVDEIAKLRRAKRALRRKLDESSADLADWEAWAKVQEPAAPKEQNPDDSAPSANL